MPTTTTTAVTPSSTSSCGNQLYQIPTQDAACAAVVKGNISAVMHECCKNATPHTYDNDCSIYCLAQGQDIHNLSNCLTTKSGDYQGVFCNAALNATATAAANSTKSTAGATGTKSGSSATSTSTSGAAFMNQPVSNTGLGVVAMLFCSALMAVFA